MTVKIVHALPDEKTFQVTRKLMTHKLQMSAG